METPGITAAPSARTSNPLAPKISPLLPGSVMPATPLHWQTISELSRQIHSGALRFHQPGVAHWLNDLRQRG